MKSNWSIDKTGEENAATSHNVESTLHARFYIFCLTATSIHISHHYQRNLQACVDEKKYLGYQRDQSENLLTVLCGLARAFCSCLQGLLQFCCSKAYVVGRDSQKREL